MQRLRLDRRSILVGGAALAGAAMTGAAKQPFFARHKLPLGIQLYTLGPDIAKDLDGALRALSTIGYRQVELAGMLGKTAADFRAALDRAGLTAPSAHIPAKGREGSFQGDLDKLKADLNTLGVTTAVMPSLFIPDRFGAPAANEAGAAYLNRATAGMTADDWKMNADYLNLKGKALKPAGIQVAYHNHNFEFAPLGSTHGLEILMTNTDPALVTFEVDIGWVAAAGMDPYVWLAKHKGRVKLMHVKDLKAGPGNYQLKMDPVEVGAGSLDWKRLLPAAHAAGVRNFLVEQEPPFTRPRIEAAKLSYDYLARVIA